MLRKSDLEIISHLRSDARQNITKIARATNIPISTICDKIKRFETTIIRKHTSLLDYQKLGLERKQILIKVSKEDRDNLLNFLMKSSNVNTIYKVDNRFDFIIEIVFEKLSDYYQFLEELDRFSIISKEEYYIIDDVKREAFLEKNDGFVFLSK